MASTNINIEDFLPVVKENGLNTKKNVQVTGTLTVTGATTLGATNGKQPLISGSGATVALTAAQSGSVCLFDRAAGIVYTLPASAVGLYFDFVTTTTITSNAAEVDVPASSFLQGSVMLGVNNTASSAFLANGTSHVKIASNGTTSGGILGSQYRITCVAPTIWQVSGVLAASGTVVTPFA